MHVHHGWSSQKPMIPFGNGTCPSNPLLVIETNTTVHWCGTLFWKSWPLATSHRNSWSPSSFPLVVLIALHFLTSLSPTFTEFTL